MGEGFKRGFGFGCGCLFFIIIVLVILFFLGIIFPEGLLPS